MLQLALSSAGTVCLGVPVDVSGNTMAANSHTPVLADFAINQATALNAGGSIAIDTAGNVYWTYTAADTAAAGPMQIVCVNATYAMLPKDLQVGTMAASGGLTAPQAAELDDLASALLTPAGNGANAVALTITNAQGSTVYNCAVTVYLDQACTQLVPGTGTLYTSRTGVVTFNLDSGTYWARKVKAGVNFKTNPQQVVVP